MGFDVLRVLTFCFVYFGWRCFACCVTFVVVRLLIGLWFVFVWLACCNLIGFVIYDVWGLVYACVFDTVCYAFDMGFGVLWLGW